MRPAKMPHRRRLWPFLNRPPLKTLSEACRLYNEKQPNKRIKLNEQLKQLKAKKENLHG
ncbi:MAG: hypothetical protein LBF12_03110 [Christensenellaceae bacterium]|nr:hypothetical protein [Christensenellaceae bacterium]